MIRLLDRIELGMSRKQRDRITFGGLGSRLKDRDVDVVFIELGRRNETVHVSMRRLLVVGDGVSMQMATAERNRQERDAGQYKDKFRHRSHPSTIAQVRDEGH